MEATYIDHLGDDLRVINAARTKTHKRIIEAVERGYGILGGVLYGPKGPLNIKRRGSQRYPTFSTNWGGEVFGVPVHMFAAYIYYGEAAFDRNLVVRHLNGDTEDFSKENILLGTASQNELDKSPDVRKRVAIKARASQGTTPCNEKLSRGDVEEIRAEYIKLEGRKAPNGFTKKLCDRYGVSRTVINKVVKGVYYAS